MEGSECNLHSWRSSAEGRVCPKCKANEEQLKLESKQLARVDNALIQVEKERDEALAYIVEMRTILEFYADSTNWRMNGPCDPESNNFEGYNRARDFLAKMKAWG